MTHSKFMAAVALTSCFLLFGCMEMDLADPVVDEATEEVRTDGDGQAEPNRDGAHTEADVRSVCYASNITIRNAPGGATLGTLNQWDRFSIESYYDGVWYLGTGYRQNGYYVARGFVLAQYLC